MLLGQSLSTMSNGLFALAVATTVSVDTYGSFAMSYTVLGAGLVMWRRGVLLEVSAQAGSHARVAEVRNQVLRLLIRLTPVIVVVPLAVLLLARVTISAESICLALLAPVILAQDALRIAAFARGRYWLPLVSDAAWLAVTAVAFLLATTGNLSYRGVTIVWSLAAVLALAVMGAGHRPLHPASWRPLRVTPSFLARAEGRRRRNLATGMLGPAAFVAFMAIIGRLAGAPVVATLAGVAQLMFPLTILLASLPMLLTVGGLRPERFGRRLLALMVLCALVAGGWLVILLLLPDAAGTALLGATWAYVQPVLVLGAVAAGTQAMGAAVTYTLQLRGSSRAPLSLTAVESVVRLVYAVVLASTVGTAAAILGANIALQATVTLTSLVFLARTTAAGPGRHA